MKVKIPKEIYKRAGNSEDNINVTLADILGYFTSSNNPDELFALIDVRNQATATATVNIDDNTIEQVNIKFNSDAYDIIIAKLLVFAYCVGD